MFAPSHMAVGALCEAGLKHRLPVAVVAFTSAAVLDSSDIWHAPYRWPDNSPEILHFLPYPHDAQSALVVTVLIAVTLTVAVLLRAYWWGMMWALVPDILDWVIIRPITGEQPIHDIFSRIETAWGFAVEMAFIAVIVGVLIRKRRNSPAE